MTEHRRITRVILENDKSSALADASRTPLDPVWM